MFTSDAEFPNPDWVSSVSAIPVAATSHAATARFGRNRPPVSPLETSEAVPILVDTGVLLGAIDADDADHNECAALLNHRGSGLLVPVTVIAETAWQLDTNVGADAEAALIDSVIAGELTVIGLTTADYVRLSN